MHQRGSKRAFGFLREREGGRAKQGPAKEGYKRVMTDDDDRLVGRCTYFKPNKSTHARFSKNKNKNKNKNLHSLMLFVVSFSPVFSPFPLPPFFLLVVLELHVHQSLAFFPPSLFPSFRVNTSYTYVYVLCSSS